MKISDELYWELSDLVLGQVREIDELLHPKGGWKGWSTGGMRILTNGLLQAVLDKLEEY